MTAPGAGKEARATASVGELIRNRRAIRKFAPGVIPDADVREVLEAARWAPSPANLQPARFIWVRDAKLKDELQDLARDSKAMSAYWDPSSHRADPAARSTTCEHPWSSRCAPIPRRASRT